jgi:hypothetical protein
MTTSPTTHSTNPQENSDALESTINNNGCCNIIDCIPNANVDRIPADIYSGGSACGGNDCSSDIIDPKLSDEYVPWIEVPSTPIKPKIDPALAGLSTWMDMPGMTIPKNKMTESLSKKESQEFIWSDNRDEAVKQFVDNAMEKIEESSELQMDRYGLGAWSISKLKVLNKCPLNFFFKYVLKLKVPEIIGGRTETLSADVGSAAHRILELVMMGKTQSVSYELTKKEFVPSKLTEEQWVEYVETLNMQITAFKDRMDSFFRKHPVKRVFTEMKIGVTKDWEPCGFFDKNCYFRGIIDLSVQLEDDALIIIDHKTGGFSGGGIKVYESQLNSYKPLFHYGVEKVKGSLAHIHFIRDSEVKAGQWHDENAIQKRLVNQLEWDFDCAVDKVRELGYFKHIAGSTCKWCDYESLCKKDKVLKPVELATKRVIPITKV